MGYMNSAMTLEINSSSQSETLKIAGILGHSLHGGEVIELIGDVGAGKTEFVRGLAKGIGTTDEVSSPSFTIKNIYRGKNGLELHHFDFYRLTDPGLMKNDILEVLVNPKAIVVVEWGEIIENILPSDRMKVTIKPISENGREFRFESVGDQHQTLLRVFK
jgi:tRNA threonylcarbamoyladenosine biosynthesis protein TsaE